MTRIALGLCLVLVPAVAGAQSLAETARKERERREEIEKAGKSTRTIGTGDLAAADGRVANDPTEGSAPASAERESEGSAEVPVSAESGSSPREDAEAYWRQRTAEVRGRLARAQERYRVLDRAIRIGQPAMYDENGTRMMYSLASLKEMADKAQAEVKAAEADLARFLKEARQRGALPGWLR